MRFKKIISASLISLFSFACIQFIFNKTTGIWFYTYNSSGQSPSNFYLTPASFICLQPDNNYTLDFGMFDYGKWVKKGDSIILSTSSGKINVFVIDKSMGKDLKLSIEPGVICDFERQDYSFSKDAVMPFSLNDNKWRIKATHKESEAAIKARLINHCKFWRDYFTWALNNNIQVIDVRSTPSPIKIYGNGFALKEFNDLPAEWKNYFYDSADCQLATNMLDDVFTKNDIAWAHTDSKYKVYIGAFEQLEQMLGNKLSLIPSIKEKNLN